MKKQTIFLAFLIILSMCFAGCGSEAPEEYADLSSLYETILQNPDMPEMIQLSEKRMYNLFGIDVSSYPQAIVAVCGDSLRVDEIWLIQAENKEEISKFADLAKARIEQKYSENVNYLPDQATIAKEGIVIQKGNYIALFISPDTEKMEKNFQEAFSRK